MGVSSASRTDSSVASLSWQTSVSLVTGTFNRRGRLFALKAGTAVFQLSAVAEGRIREIGACDRTVHADGVQRYALNPSLVGFCLAFPPGGLS